VDARILTLRECADFLEAGHGGDQEVACLRASVRTALGLIAELLAVHDGPLPRGYKDACDLLVKHALCEADLAERLKLVFDVAERAPTAWSSLHPGELRGARDQGATALRELADLLEGPRGLTIAPATA
jgi:hypothetical protein